jgi:pyruvate formate lyase activating enzyme
VQIAAFVPLSLSDHEGRVAAVVFLRGCNFRCPFCHNPDLVVPERATPARLARADVLRALGERRAFLDSVVITGGEPTVAPGLASFLADIRSLGLLVKLDTNGSRPDVLEELLARQLVDLVAMDVKAPRDRYPTFAGLAVDLAAIEGSMRLIRARAPDSEFRTTVAPGLAESDLLEIAQWLEGATRYVLQPFRVPPEKALLDPAWAEREALSLDALRQIWKGIAPLVRGGGVRG